MNTYLARCQYLLRQGKAGADILVYYPWLGFPTTLAACSRHEEPLFNGQFDTWEPRVPLDSLLQVGLFLGLSREDPRTTWLVEQWPLLQALEKQGYSWAWVNDERLAGAGVADGGMEINGSTYKALLLPGSESMAPASAERLRNWPCRDCPWS